MNRQKLVAAYREPVEAPEPARPMKCGAIAPTEIPGDRQDDDEIDDNDEVIEVHGTR